MSEAPIATYSRMDEGTVEDYAIMASYKPANLAALPDRLMSLLVELGDREDGSPLDAYAHSLQSATLAYHDGAEDETVFAALFHDIGQFYSENNHSEVSAAILKPYLSERAYQVVKHHGMFQGYYYFDKIGWDPNARDAYAARPGTTTACASASATTRSPSVATTRRSRSSSSSPWCGGSWERALGRRRDLREGLLPGARDARAARGSRWHERRRQRYRPHPAHGEQPAGVRTLLGTALPLPRVRTLLRNENVVYCIGSRTGILVRRARRRIATTASIRTRQGCITCASGRAAVPTWTRSRASCATSSAAAMVHDAEEGEQFAPGYYSALFEDPDGIRVEVNYVPGKGHFGEGGRLGPGGAGPAEHFGGDGLRDPGWARTRSPDAE